jgi:glycosyltransferase involved in cell wall biosynthesis
MGRIEHGQLATYVAESYVVVTPTRREFPEGRCMSAIEALVLGVPVVAPAFGPFEFLIEEGKNGLLYEANNMEALVSSLRTILGDTALRDELAAGAQGSREKLIQPERSFSEAMAEGFGALSARVEEYTET